MDFQLSDEQALLRDITRDLLARTYDAETRIKVIDTELGWSREVWSQLADTGILGLGFDPPVVSPDLPETSAEAHLDPGTVLAVTGYVWAQGVGAVYQRDAVLITDDGAEVLTTSPSFSGQSAVGIG